MFPILQGFEIIRDVTETMTVREAEHRARTTGAMFVGIAGRVYLVKEVGKSRARMFDYNNLYDWDTGKGCFCADKEKFTAEQAKELFKRECRYQMDALNFHGMSAAEYREKIPPFIGYVRFTVGPDYEGDPSGWYTFLSKKPYNEQGKPKYRGLFEVWAFWDGTEYDY